MAILHKANAEVCSCLCSLPRLRKTHFSVWNLLNYRAHRCIFTHIGMLINLQSYLFCDIVYLNSQRNFSIFIPFLIRLWKFTAPTLIHLCFLLFSFSTISGVNEKAQKAKWKHPQTINFEWYMKILWKKHGEILKGLIYDYLWCQTLLHSDLFLFFSVNLLCNFKLPMWWWF